MPTFLILASIYKIIKKWRGIIKGERAERSSKNNMNLYKVKADCDWGLITDRATIEATSFGVAFGRAGKMAYRLARRRPKYITLRLDFIGKKQKAPSGENA